MYDVLSHYLEVNFEDVVDQLTHALTQQPPAGIEEAPSVLARTHLRQVIRQLRIRGERERARGRAVTAASAAVTGPAGSKSWLDLAALSDVEHEVLERYLGLFRHSLERPATRLEAARLAEPVHTAVTRPVASQEALPAHDRIALHAGTILEAIATEAHTLLAVDSVQAWLLSGPQRLVLRAAAPPEIPAPLRNLELDAAGGWLARAFASREAVASDDLQQETSAPGEDRWVEAAYRGFAAVALRHPDGAPFGVLAALRTSAWRINADDAGRLAQLGREASTAMQRHSLYARVEELAIAGERLKLAREIHDGLASDLAAVVALFKYYEQRRSQDPDDADSVLVQIRGMVEEVLQGARDILQALRPRTVQSEGLIPAVLKLVDEFGRSSMVETSTSIRGDDMGLQPEEREALFQILRESLANIRKHALARRVSVQLDLANQPITLAVRDDGRGFDVNVLGEDPARAGSYGLLGMRERAALLGGSLEVTSVPGRGSTVTFYGRRVADGR